MSYLIILTALGAVVRGPIQARGESLPGLGHTPIGLSACVQMR
jgi:hypothetical protein